MDHVRAWLETADINIPEPTDGAPPWGSVEFRLGDIGCEDPVTVGL